MINASGTQQQYRYDCAGRLAQVLDGSGNVLATYSYGAGNQRLMSVEGGVTTYFAWAGGKIIAEYEPWGTNALIWKTSYVYLGGRLLATTSGADGNETRFHHPDRLGTRLVTTALGTVVTEQLSMPFGTMLPFTQTYGGENSYQHPTLSNPSKKRFTSYDRSDVTELDYAKNRFYSSQQGRFTSVDPIEMSATSLGDPQTLNMYAYCGNDPINCIDPDGLFFGKLFGWIGKAFKFLFKVAAVALVVLAIIAFPGSAVAGLALLGLAGASGLAGWHNGKLGTIAGRILSAGLAWKGNARTPGTFPSGTGVGGVQSFLGQENEQISPDNTIQIPTEPAYGSYWEYLKARFTKERLKRDLNELWKDWDHRMKTGEGVPMVGAAGAIGSGANWAWKSVPTFGHTFLRHGAGSKIFDRLMGRAASTGVPQGQWLNNEAAATFLRGFENVNMVGPFSARIPAGLGRVVYPGGRIAAAEAALIVPRAGGVFRVAYPVAISP